MSEYRTVPLLSVAVALNVTFCPGIIAVKQAELVFHVNSYGATESFPKIQLKPLTVIIKPVVLIPTEEVAFTFTTIVPVTVEPLVGEEKLTVGPELVVPPGFLAVEESSSWGGVIESFLQLAIKNVILASAVTNIRADLFISTNFKIYYSGYRKKILHLINH